MLAVKNSMKRRLVLLESIDTSDLIGLRDRALIGVMGYTFARVSAAGTLRVEDYFQQGRRSWLRCMRKVVSGTRCPATTA
jgi:integrase/recombinase XerD